MSTHDSLIELTDTLIQQNGYQGFSYADLAKTLGIRKASIHYHFQTKTDLGIAYCEYKKAGFLAPGSHPAAVTCRESPPEGLYGGLSGLRGHRPDVAGCTQ
ncbi:transcriptional regulator [Escherichia coli]|nr:transcriptional regulator [Escherichia coli]